MRKILLLFLCCCIAASCGTLIHITDDNRDVNNFTYNDGQVTWSYVYHFAASENKNVRDWYNSTFNIKKENEKTIIGETPQNALPLDAVGLNRMDVVMLLAHPCIVYFTTDFKEDRCRVVVNQIIWQPQVGIATSGLYQGVGTIDLNELATKEGSYRSVFYNTTSEHLNQLLYYTFTPRLNQTETDDNW